MKKNIVLITIALLSVLLIVSCSNKTQGSKAVGLSIGRVETVFADDAWNYDVVYKSGSTRYISEVVVNLSNGIYRYPSLVKAEILKKDGETWKSIRKDVTDKFTFTDSGVYKIKYTAEGMTAETGEFPVYKPGELYNFSATKPVYAEGAQMVKTDFTYTYCYKDKNGSIGLTNSLSQDEVLIYTRDENGTFITLLDDQDMYKSSGNKVYAGIVIASPDTPEGYINKEIEIKILKNCKTDIKGLAHYKLNETTGNYEFSGNIYKRFYDNDGTIIGRTVILGKTDDGVNKAEGFNIQISNLIPSEGTLSPNALKEEYDKVTKENAWADETDFGPKAFSGPGYILLKITEDGKGEITKDNPAFIRISK